MTPAKLQELAQGMVVTVRSFVARSLASRDASIALLTRQRDSADQLLADLEARVSKLERERAAE